MTYSTSEKSKLICRTEPFDFYDYRSKRIGAPAAAYGMYSDDDREVLLFYKVTEVTVDIPANEGVPQAVPVGVAAGT